MGWIWWRIFRKAGYHGSLGILCLIPIANIIMFAILAFRDWPIQKALSTEVKPSGSLPFVLIMVIVVVSVFPIALLAAIAIPNLLRARMIANQSEAHASVRAISGKIEAYASAHGEQYPLYENDFMSALPAYLSQGIDKKTIRGYEYLLQLNPQGYKIMARPSECAETGLKIFTAETGNKFSEDNCKEFTRP